MKKLLSIVLIMSVLFTFASCNKNVENSSPNKESSVIDNTEASLNHEKIYYYQKDNVPFDDDNDCYPFCFITPYLAAKPTGGAVIVFPGGGYNHLSNSTSSVSGYGQGVDNDGNQKEASSIVEWYNKSGISVFVVNYRTTAVDKSLNYKGIMSDALRAVRYVIYNAEKYYVNLEKIAVQGYSAGGHLASMVLTAYDFDELDENYVKDEIDNILAKPAAAVLCYSVLSFSDGICHAGTRKIFTGSDKTLYNRFSPDLLVNENTSPCFLWCHKGDNSVKSENTLNFAAALDNFGVYNEVHVFDDNGNTVHGVGVAQEYEEAKFWPEYATEFLKKLGF